MRIWFSSKWFDALLIAGLGGLLCLVFFGSHFIDPRNIAWLGGGLDPTQHYLGWVFFRQTPWQWPLGVSPAFGMEIASSIVFTDSIPLAAFVLKGLNLFLPAPFQYLGIWTLLCFILQGLIAYALVGLVSNDRTIRILLALFFIVSPAMLIRMGFQTGLASHFLILAALYLNLRKPTRTQFFAWLILIVITALVHFYLLAMVLGLWISDELRRWQLKEQSWRQIGLHLLIVLGCLISIFWQAGYFLLMGAVASGNQYGIGRLNILSIFNPDGWSYILPNIPLAHSVYEGFNYLGLGMLLCLVLTIGIAVRRRQLLRFAWHPIWIQYRFLIILSLLFTLFAITNQVGVGLWSLNLSLPDAILSVAGILRASGRLFWPVYYLLMLFILWVIVRSFSRVTMICVLSIALVIQVTDTSAGWWSIRKKYTQAKSQEWPSLLTSDYWHLLGKHYANLIIIPAKNNFLGWHDWASFAASYHMTTNAVFLARYNQSKLDAANQALNDRLRTGNYDPKSLYILENDKLIPALLHLNPQKDLLARIDGFYVLAPGWVACDTCMPVNPDQLIKVEQLIPKLGEQIVFGRIEHPKYLLNVSQGWAHLEPWGIWSDGSQAQLIMGIPRTGAKSLTLTTRAFVTPAHPTQEIDLIVNGQKRQEAILTKDNNNQITIPITPQDRQAGQLIIDFRFKNPARPKDLSMGEDQRLLSVGLERAVFE